MQIATKITQYNQQYEKAHQIFHLNNKKKNF